MSPRSPALSEAHRRWRWRIFASTWLCYFGFYFCRKPFYIAKSTLGRELHFDATMLGLIGSATKRVRFERRLRDDGFGDAELARLTCPIGIAALKGKAPAVIAVALAAQLLQLTEDQPA